MQKQIEAANVERSGDMVGDLSERMIRFGGKAIARGESVALKVWGIELGERRRLPAEEQQVAEVNRNSEQRHGGNGDLNH